MNIVKKIYFEVDDETIIKLENKYYYHNHSIIHEQATFQDSYDLFTFFYDFHDLLDNKHPLVVYTSHENLPFYFLTLQDYKLIVSIYHKTALISRFEREDKKFEKF